MYGPLNATISDPSTQSQEYALSTAEASVPQKTPLKAVMPLFNKAKRNFNLILPPNWLCDLKKVIE